MVTLSSAMDDYKKLTSATSKTTTLPTNTTSSTSSTSRGITLDSALSDLSKLTGKTYTNTTDISSPMPITEDANLQQKSGFWRNIFQKSSYFDDGWQAGDVLATIWDTGKSAASSVAEGFLNTVEGIADFGQYTLADVVDFFGATQAAENIRENAKFNSTGAIFGKNTSASDNLFQPKWKENLDQRSVLGTSGRQIAEGVGNVGALIGSSYLGGQIIGGAIPGAATSGFGQATWAEIGASSFGSYSSAYGNTVSRELNTGTSMEDARKAGVVSGFAEAISEQFFNSMAGMHTAGLGETIFGKVVPKTVNESVKKFFNTKAGKVASAIIDGLEEGSEEILSNIFTAIGNDIAYAVDPTYQANGMDTQTGNAWEDLKAQFKNTETWDAFWSAALTSAILSGAQTMIPNKQRQELIDAYAEDNNLTKEEAQSRLDGQQQIEGQDNQTIEKTIYSNVNTNMTIDEINAITNVDDINDLISQLQEELAQDRDTRTMSRSDLEPIANLLKTALDRQTQLIEEMKIPEQTDTFKDSLDELENINENPEITPEAKLAKNTEVQATADAIDKETTIKIADNKKGVRVRYNQVEQDAISYINQVNVQRTATGQTPITIIQNPTQDQLRLADALEAFGRHAVFARDLPGSFVTPSTDVNPNLGQVLFINDKISTGLLAKSNITNKNQPLVYAIGHEMFHSLRQTEPGVYDNFVEYVANTISNEQILQFMEMYDPIDSQGLLEGLQINGQYNLDEILKDPKKYTSQYQSLLNIAEEMTANEFGGMFTDVDYMTNLATQNKSLFERIVEAIKNFFKDIDKPIYNSPLTHYQISTIRQNFEDIINNVNNSLSTTAGLMNEIQSTRSGHQTTNDVQTQETMQKTQQKTANKTQREQKPKSTRQTSEQKTTWADVTKAYDIANRSDEISSVTNLREVYDKYLKDGGKQGAEFETLIDGLENTFKTPNSTRQKEEKFTQQVNLSGQVQKSTRQVLKKETTQKTKLPIKETPVEQPAYIKSFDNNVRSDGSNAYFVFEDVVSDNTLTQEELKDLKEHAVKVAKTKEIKDDIRNWTPEIMNQEQQEIQSLESKAIDSTKSNKTLPNLYDRARQQYDILLESGLDSAREKAKQYYQEYKDAGGRRKISGLEEQESSLPRKELNINDEVKTSSMTNDAWFTNIEKMYDTYNKSTPADKQKRRAGLITAYTNYRQKGGTQIIEELENIITSKENTEETKENLFNTMVDAKYLPNTSSEYLEDKPKDKKVSKFFSNTVTNSPFAEDVFSILRTNYDMKYYEALSDEQSLENGKRNIAEKGEQAVYTLLGKDSLDKNDTATAVLLLSYYKATKNYALQEAIFNKFRLEATKSGQFIQSLESKAIDSTKSNKTLPNLYDRARQQYDILLESGLDSAREKAKQYYQEYKDAGGRRKISGLEEQESSLPRKELNINDEVKTSSMTNDAWFTNIEKMYDTYNKSTPADKQKRRAGLITAYTNYRQKGGTQIIEELENIITSKENTEETKENLFNTMVDAKYLPNTSSEYLEDKPKDKKVSKFFSNTVTNSPFAEDVFSILRTNYDMKYYEALSDEQSLENGKRNIAEKGEQAVYTLLGKDSLDKNDTATAVLLLSYYKATKNYALQEAIFNKFRLEATKSGQFIQSLKMLKYLSPEVLINSLQTELDNFEEMMKESRDPLLQAWIREEFNRDNLRLTEAEKLWIESMWERANKLDPDSNEYKVVMAQVYAYVANKIPKSLTTKIKDFRRVGMLANIKTQGRNVLSNVFALPVNILSDFFGSRLDKRLASKTGMRTQGTFRAGQFMEGTREGAREAIRDYKLGINTQSMNAYERQTGKTFSDNNFVGRGLNKITDATNFGLDMGDRPIELGWESNALANIMDLNGHEVASELDKRLAEEEATEKVWKNKGKMAELAIGTRNTLNKIHIGNLGLGDMILPFVLTPANLAAATYNYSPAAVLSVAKNALDFNNTIKNNAPFEEKVLAQKKLVDSVGRMTAGTVLYAIAYAIAKAGKITGDEDDDKDVAAMMQSMGWQKYSIKIGDTYVSYDWAEPFANPFAVMAEIQRQRENGEFKNNDELSNALQIIAQAFKIGGTRLQDQSFLSSLQSIFSGQDSIAEGLIDFAAGLPASFVPTALKQVADIADGTAKMTYDKTSMANTALNKMLVKIPWAKSLLPTKQTTLGNDARKYKEIEHIGDLFMRMFNSAISPASVSTDTSGEIGDEFFDVYNHTGDATIMPQIAIKNISYDSDNDGETEKYQFTLEQQSQLQKDMGKIVTDGMNDLMFNDTYNTATYEQKATALTSLVQYAKGKALEQSGYVPNYQIKSGNAAQINNYTTQGLSVGEAVMYDSIINAIKADKDAEGETVKGSQNGKKAYTIMNMPISDNSKDVMLHLISPNSTTPETTDSLSNLRTEDEFISYYSLGRHDSFVNNKFSRDDIDVATNYFNFDAVNFTQYANELASIRSDKDANGNTVTNSKKRKIIEYLNTLPLNPIQKTYLYGLSGYSLKAYQNDLFNYINGLNISAEEKKKVWSELGFSA